MQGLQLSTSTGLLQQVCRPVAVGLLCRLQALTAATGATSTRCSAGRWLHSGTQPLFRRRRMGDTMEPLSPKPRKATEGTPSAFSSPKAAEPLRRLPPLAGLGSGAAGFSSSAGASAAASKSASAGKSSAAAAAVPPLQLSALNSMETQPSMTDLVSEHSSTRSPSTPSSSTQQPQPQPASAVMLPHMSGMHTPLGGDLHSEIILDPATPRTPKHQIAEQVMTTGSTAQVLKRHMDSVIKVFATHTKPNFELPWQRRQQYTSKSTGFAVKTPDGERWLLTNAHSVSYATQVQLKRRGDDEKYMAKVLAVGTEADLALLTVEDDEFWIGITPLELGELPALQENVAVLGYPIGGDSLAVSAGVVSRVQMTHYSHGCMSLLAVQTDAAINSGNSGGPVLNAQGKCIGVAFQSLTGDTQSIGYVIPTSVVHHFLNDYVRNQRYTGFPSLNLVWQEMDSKALKRAYGMQEKQKGVLLRSVAAASDEARVLRPDDILLRIDGTELGNDGTVPFRHGERVDFKYLVTSKFCGDTVVLDILRDGQEMSVEVRLSEYQHLVPPHLRNGKPSFFMCGGLVFTACTDPYLVQRYGSLGSSPVRLMAKTYFGTKDNAEQQVVVLSHILACGATTGYESTMGIKDAPVVRFNGTPVRNLAHLARLVMDCGDPFLRFDLESGNKVVVLDTPTARECTQRILEDHNISAQMSRDIQDSIEAAKRQEAEEKGREQERLAA